MSVKISIDKPTTSPIGKMSGYYITSRVYNGTRIMGGCYAPTLLHKDYKDPIKILVYETDRGDAYRKRNGRNNESNNEPDRTDARL